MASKGFCPRSLWSLPFMGEEHRKYRWGGDQTVPKRRFTVSRRVSEVVTQTRAAQKVHVHTLPLRRRVKRALASGTPARASTPPRRWSGVRSTRTGKCVVPTAKRKTDDEAEIDLMRHRQCEDLDRGRSEDDPSNALYRVSLVAQSGELAIPREALFPLRFSGFRRRYAGVTFADVAKRVS